MNRRLAGAIGLVSLLCTAAPASGASVTLQDKGQLEALLASATPCCVIDGRNREAQRIKPLANTLAYRKGLKIKPSGAVVVIADSDARAVQIGEALAKSSAARQVVAVRGGAATWLAAQGIQSGLPPWATSFVIPRDTCQQGEPLQKLRSGPR